MLKYLIGSVLLSLFSTHLTGQSSYAYFKEKYPEDPLVGILYTKKLNIDIAKGETQITYTNNEEVMYIGEFLNNYSDRSIHSSHFMQVNKIVATVTEPSGKTSKIKDFKESGFTDDNIFSDDSKNINYHLGNLYPGSKSTLDVEYNIGNLRMLPVMHLSPYIPVSNCVFEVTYPATMEIATLMLHADSIEYTFTENKKGNKITRKYTFTDLKSKKIESDSFDWRYYSPQLHVRVKSYVADNDTIPVLRNLDDLNTWYHGFLAQCDENIEQFQSFTNTITAGLHTEQEKTRAIFKWVQHNIRYIAIEDGMMGFIPQKASLVLENRYGDCKGMANLLQKMLRSQGIEAYHAWVGTRKLPYTYEQLASPVVDNHMITYVNLAGKDVFLDATNPNIPFGYPTKFIQDKQALINLSADAYKVIWVEVPKAATNLSLDSCELYIKHDTLYGTCRSYGTGYVYEQVNSRVDDNNYDSQVDYVKLALKKGSNKFILDTVSSVSFANDTSMIAYSFHIPSYVLRHENESYLNLNLHRNNLPAKVDADRKNELEFSFCIEEKAVYKLQLTNNQLSKTFPERVSLDDGGIEFNCNYTQAENAITRVSSFSITKLFLKQSEFANWNKSIAALQKQFAKQIIITHP